MNIATMFIFSFFIILMIVLAYHFYIERPEEREKANSKVIQLQSDGFDFILYKGKISEMFNDYQRFWGNMDVVVYSKSLFIGFLNPKKTYLELPAKAIHFVKYEPNKVTIHCFKEVTGTKKITLKTKSTKQLYLMSKKIDFISRRSKKVSAI